MEGGGCPPWRPRRPSLPPPGGGGVLEAAESRELWGGRPPVDFPLLQQHRPGEPQGCSPGQLQYFYQWPLKVLQPNDANG